MLEVVSGVVCVCVEVGGSAADMGQSTVVATLVYIWIPHNLTKQPTVLAFITQSNVVNMSP